MLAILSVSEFWSILSVTWFSLNLKLARASFLPSETDTPTLASTLTLDFREGESMIAPVDESSWSRFAVLP